LGWGNIQALESFLSRIYCQIRIVDQKLAIEISESELRWTDVFIPGVGSANLFPKEGDVHQLSDFCRKCHRVIGICVGFHFMCRSSEESKGAKLLELLPLDVKKLKNQKLNLGYFDFGTQGISKSNKWRMYFCHSYGVQAPSKLDGCEFRSVEASDNEHYIAYIVADKFIGLQFHPEKSGQLGVEFIDSIVRGRVLPTVKSVN